MRPTVSVIVPCYQAGPYLKRFVDSLRAQSYTGPWDAFLIDDGSPEPLVLPSSCVDVRLHVIRTPHRGVSAARNCGIEASSGEIILFADPDDALTEDWITNLVTGIEGVDWAWGSFRWVTPTETNYFIPPDVGKVYRGGDVKARAWRAVFGYRLRDVLRYLTPARLWKGCAREYASVCTRAFRRTVMADLRFDESLPLFEDAMFLSAYALRAQSMRILGEVGYLYYYRTQGQMTQEPLIHFVENKKALLIARQKLDPTQSHWRGSFYLSLLEIMRKAGFAQAWQFFQQGFKKHRIQCGE